MIQLLFNANLLLVGAFGLTGLVMLVGMALDSANNLKNNKL